MPGLDGRTRPSVLMTNTPSVSFFVLAGFSSPVSTAAPGRCGFFCPLPAAHGRCPFVAKTSSRTVVAWIGIATTPLRVAS